MCDYCKLNGKGIPDSISRTPNPFPLLFSAGKEMGSFFISRGDYQNDLKLSWPPSLNLHYCLTKQKTKWQSF